MIVVIVHIIVYYLEYCSEGIALFDFVIDFIFHMSKEAFLGSIVPAGSFPRHGTDEVGIFHEIVELPSFVMDALVTVDYGFIGESFAMDQDKTSESVQDELLFHAEAEFV